MTERENGIDDWEKERPWLTALLQRGAIGWRLLLDALLIVLALFLRNFVVWAIVVTGGESWEIAIVRVVSGVGFILGALSLLISDVVRAFRRLRPDSSPKTEGQA